MQTAKLTATGQITVPEQIRNKLNLKTGDKIIFIENDNDGNTIIMGNSSVAALKKLQEAMEGQAEKAGIMDDDDIIEICGEVRRELYKKKYADND
jgi:AbrB family looped-hinge helix DNA binding protein